jgi:ElaB/YqjD/DUF883 family membrane-anchored ribosome-binding protein
MTTSSTIANNAAAGTVTGMADRAHQAVERAADKAAPALERARTTVHNTIDKVADQAACGVDWAAENSKQLVRKSSELSEVASVYVRERPLVAIAGAVALGYLIGRLMR